MCPVRILQASIVSAVLVHEASAASLCMDVPAAGEGVNVQVWGCNGLPQQQWDASYIPRSLFNSPPLFLDPLIDTTNGNLVTTGPGVDVDQNPVWHLVPDSGEIQFGSSGKCLDAGDMQEGTQLMIWDCNGMSQQKWGFDSQMKVIYLADSRRLQTEEDQNATSPEVQAMKDGERHADLGENSTRPHLRGALRDGARQGAYHLGEVIKPGRENETLTASVAGDGAWDLNENTGPWCNSGECPGRESASAQGLGDRGWDPCCFWSGCNIWDAVWDSKGPNSDGKGTWCWRVDFDKNGGTCWNGQSWDYWTGGFVYDWCPCSDGDYNCKDSQKQMCIATSDDGVWWDWQQCFDWTHDSDCWKNLFAPRCGTEQSKDICYNGFIQAPNGDGVCPDGFNSKEDDQGLLMCWPSH